MSHATIWWVVAGILVAAELFTGTFYLLMLAVGATTGAIAAHMGLNLTAQLLTGAGVAIAVVVLWHWYRQRHPRDAHEEALRTMHLDVGETVQIDVWLPDGSASVKYRGALWGATLGPGQLAVPGAFRIVDVVGNRLILENLPNDQ